MNGMKRLFLVLCTSMLVLPLSAQETKTFRLHVFGSEYSGPTNVFQKDAEANPALKQRLAELDYRYLDADNIDAKEKAYRYLLLYGTKEFPVFIVTDPSGDVYKGSAGYASAEELLKWLDPADLASREATVGKFDELSDGKLRRMARAQESLPFLLRLIYSQWCIGIEPGVVFSNLAQSEGFTDYKTGYYTSVYVKRYLPWKSRVQGGLAFYSLGGKQVESGDNLRLNYLSLPIDFEKKILSPSLKRGISSGDLNLGIGAYGSYLLSDKAPGGMTAQFNDWDAGVRVRLVLQQGSFRLSAGYQRGLVDVMPGPEKAYNQSFQIGAALTLGD